MITYKFEQSICAALNLPHEYMKSDQEYILEHETWLASQEKVPSLFKNQKHTEESKRLMSQTLSDGRRKKPKSDLWKKCRSENAKGKRTAILCKPVLFNGTIYPSIKNAAEQNQVHRRVIRKKSIPILA